LIFDEHTGTTDGHGSSGKDAIPNGGPHQVIHIFGKRRGHTDFCRMAWSQADLFRLDAIAKGVCVGNGDRRFSFGSRESKKHLDGGFLCGFTIAETCQVCLGLDESGTQVRTAQRDHDDGNRSLDQSIEKFFLIFGERHVAGADAHLEKARHQDQVKRGAGGQYCVKIVPVTAHIEQAEFEL